MSRAIIICVLACVFSVIDARRADSEGGQKHIHGIRLNDGPSLEWKKDPSCTKVRKLFPESALIKLDLDTSGLLKETSLEWAWMNKNMQISVGGVESLKLALPMRLSKQKGAAPVKLTIGMPGFSVKGGITDLKARLSMAGGNCIPDFSKLTFDAVLKDMTKPALEVGLALQKNEMLDENKLIIASVGAPNIRIDNLHLTGAGSLWSKTVSFFANLLGKHLSSLEVVQDIVVGWILRLASDVVNDLLPSDIIDIVLQDGHGFDLLLNVDATVSGGLLSGDIRADHAKLELSKESLLSVVEAATRYVLPLIPHKQDQESDEGDFTARIAQALDWGLSLASGAVLEGDIIVGPASESGHPEWGPELAIDSILHLAGASDAMHTDYKARSLGPLVRAGLEPLVAVLGAKGGNAVQFARQKWTQSCEYAQLPNHRRMPVILALTVASEQLHAFADMLNKVTLTTKIQAKNQQDDDGWQIIISAVNHYSQDEPVLHAHLSEQNLEALIGMLPPGVLIH